MMYELDHLGHWKVLETPLYKDEIDLGNYIGFVYVITFDDGSKYVGAKKIWKRIAKPPKTFKRGPKKGFEQSDWRTYTSSSNVVNDKIASGENPKEYLIVGFYDTWGKTLYAEALLQIGVNIFGNDIWLNNQIEGHFTRSCYDDTVLINNKCYIDYFLGAKYKVFTNDLYMDVEILNEHKKSYCVSNLVPYDSLLQLLKGRIDEYKNLKLPKDIQRRDWRYKYNDKYYYTQKELKDVLTDVSPKDWDKQGVKINKVETRNEYINRLQDSDISIEIRRRYI